MSKSFGLLTVLFLFGCGYYEAQARLAFGDRCKMSTFFAQLFGKRCDPFLAKADCRVGEWSQWSSANKNSDGKCSQSRTRKVQQLPRNGGLPCPALKEEKTVPCSSGGSSAEEALAILQKGLGGFGASRPPALPPSFAKGPPSFGPGSPNFGKVLRPPNSTWSSRGVAKRMVTFPSTICPSDRDIVIIVDASGSVGTTHFQSALDDLSELIPLLCGFQPEFISCKAYKLAMITYGSSPQLAFDLNDLENRHTSQNNVKNDIKTRPVYTGGFTATGDALQLAADRVLQTAHGMRPHSNKTILLLTDGHSNRGRNPITVSRQMFETYDQLSIVAVGIGRNIGYDELIGITNHNNPTNALAFLTEDFNSFHDIVEQIKTLLNEAQQDACSADILAKKRK